MPRLNAIVDQLHIAAKAELDNPAGIVTSIADRFKRYSAPWATELQYVGVSIFTIASGFALCTTVFHAVKRSSTMAELVKEIGYFLVWNTVQFLFLTQAYDLAPAIIETLTDAATRASGLKANVASDPSAMADIGFDIYCKWLDGLELSLESIFIDFVAAFFIIAAVLFTFIIALNHLEILCTGWILLTGGLVMLGFAAHSETSDIAKNYYRCILGTGCQHMGVILTLSLGKSLLEFCISDIHDFSDGKQLLSLFAATGFVMYIGCGIPAAFAKMVMGQVPGANQSMGGVVSSIIGVGAATGAVIATGGAAIAAIGAEAAGAAEAIQASQQASGKQSRGSTPNLSSGTERHRNPDSRSKTNNQSAESFSGTYGHNRDDASGGHRPPSSNTGNHASSQSQESGKPGSGDRAKGKPGSGNQGQSSKSQIAENLKQGLRDYADAKAYAQKRKFQRRVRKSVGGQVAKHIRRRAQKRDEEE